MSSVKIVESKMFDVGLEDSGKTSFECKDCGKKIGSVWHTQKDLRYEDGKKMFIDVIFKCPFCKSQSYQKKIEGGFHFDFDVDEVAGVDFKYEDNLVIVETALQK